MSNLKVKKGKFGLLSDGTKVHLYTISNGNMSFSATDYGCTITSIILPGKNNSKVDVVLGYSSLEGYLLSNLSFGTVVGRFANRIADASFTLNGTKYELDHNDGNNCLHGGFNRWEKMMWKARKIHTENGTGIEFTHTSHDGEQGFPGTLKAKVIYTLSEDNVLTFDYQAVTDKATPVNITNHSYFNLKGYNGGNIEDQILQLNCNHYLEVNDKLIPTGNKIDVKGTAFDFTVPKPIGKDIADTGIGYDHCYLCDMESATENPKLAAVLKDPASGRKMSVKTTQPGIQLYTSNFIEGFMGKQGIVYHNHDAVCLETQCYPDSPNHPDFPDCILKPGEVYHQITQYIFE